MKGGVIMIKSSETFINSVNRKLAFLHWNNYLINNAIASRKMLGRPPLYVAEKSDRPVNTSHDT